MWRRRGTGTVRRLCNMTRDLLDSNRIALCLSAWPIHASHANVARRTEASALRQADSHVGAAPARRAHASSPEARLSSAAIIIISGGVYNAHRRFIVTDLRLLLGAHLWPATLKTFE